MVAILNCTAVPYNVSNALLWLYDLLNTHVSLPEKDNNAKYSLYCYINISTPLGFKIKNISFSTCNSGFLYLYHEKNSHVSKDNGNIGICFSSPFNKIVNAIWSTENLNYTFVLSLYNSENSHVSLERKNWKLYFVLKDEEKPHTEITYPQNNSIITTVTFPVIFRDYDNGGLLCFYEVGNKTFERKCNGTVYINTYDCSNPCIIKSIVIDFAGNVEEKTYIYKLKNVPLLVQVETPDHITVPISNAITTFEIRITNPSNKEINLSIDYSVKPLMKVPEALLPKIYLSQKRLILKPGETKKIVVNITAYRIGDYLLNFIFKWKEFQANRTVLFTVSPILSKETISVFEKVLLPILYLI